jgi:hypothetical protein
MPKIAISYRRSDTSAVAGRIFDRLTGHYGKQAVFMDIDDIPIGVDFRTHIDEVLHEADVLLAVIGRAWLGLRGSEPPRMQEATDPVRVEIESALSRQTPIIPVLVDGAQMPDASQLPQAFGNFAYLNAAEVATGRDFHAHMARLIAAIDRSTGAPTIEPAAASRATATPPEPPQWTADAARYWLTPLVLLLLAHYLIVNTFDLSTVYLQAACVLVPFIFGAALLVSGGHGPLTACGFAVALGVTAAAGMTVSASLYSGESILPQTRFEWLDNFQFAGSIALSFFAGHVLARVSQKLRPSTR